MVFGGGLWDDNGMKLTFVPVDEAHRELDEQDVALAVRPAR